MVGGGHNARILQQPFCDRLRLQSLEGEAHGGIAGDLDLEAFAAPTEIPRRFEVFLAHQPVDRRRDDRLAVDEGLPAETARGHSARGDWERGGAGAGGRAPTALEVK